MQARNPLDEPFLQLNAQLGIVEESRILAAQQLQKEEERSGKAPRSVAEILEDRGELPAQHRDLVRALKQGVARTAVPGSSADSQDPPAPFPPSSSSEGSGPPYTPSSISKRPTSRVGRPPEVEEALKDERNRMGHYVLLDRVGKGGMGSVYRAWDDAVGRVVALKLLHESSYDSVERFIREAHMAGRLRHPSIATVYEVGEIQGRHYLAMDFIDGEPLGRRPCPVPRTLEIIRDAARALQHAHEHGIVHRDIKPGNIMVDRKGTIYITDFGLAKEAVPHPSTALTMPGVVVGTVEYMSPEQARGDNRGIDSRTDIFSLGATLYRLLAGRPPFPADNALDAMKYIVERNPRPIRRFNSAVSPELEAVVERAMAKDREKRQPTAAAFADDLDRLLRERRYLGRYGLARFLVRRWLPVAAAAILLALVARFALSITDSRPPEGRKADPAELTRVASIALGALEDRLGSVPPEERRSRLQREVLGRLDTALLVDPRFLPARVARIRALYLDGRAPAALEELRGIADEWRRDYRIRFLGALIALEETWGRPPLPALEAPHPEWHEPPAPWRASIAEDLRAAEGPQTEKAAGADYARDGPAARALLALLDGNPEEAAAALRAVSERQPLPLYARAWCRAAYLARQFREVRASPASTGRRERVGSVLALSADLKETLPECAGDTEAEILVHTALARRAVDRGRDPEAHVSAGLGAPADGVAHGDELRGVLLSSRILRLALSGRDEDALCEEAIRLLGTEPRTWMGRLAAAEVRLARGARLARRRGESRPLLEEAVTWADALSRQAPGWVGPKLVRASAYLRLGRPHDSLGELSGLTGSRALVLSASVRLFLAEERRRGGLAAKAELEECLRDAAAALADAPDHPEALNLAGAAGLALAEDGEEGRLDEALEHLDRALAQAPGHLDALLHRGQGRFLRAQVRREDFAGALADLDAVLEAAPGMAAARWTRGVVRFSAGLYAKAAEDWRLLPAGTVDEWIRRAEARAKP